MFSTRHCLISSILSTHSQVFVLLLLILAILCLINSTTHAYAYTCIGGIIGTSATQVACEAGQVYCQTDSSVTSSKVSSCVSDCLTGVLSVRCYSGSISNKIGYYCFVGDLYTTGQGAPPVMCDVDQYCQNAIVSQTVNSITFITSITGSCKSTCTVSSSNQCFMGDFSNQQGSICFVGTFGSNAMIMGCAYGNICKFDSSTQIGSCMANTSCTTSGTVTCTSTNLGNKQGPVCYVGQFGSAKIVACQSSQMCKTTVTSMILTGSISQGSCSASCVSSSNITCCSTDLCNAYAQNLTMITNGCSGGRFASGLNGAFIGQYTIIIVFMTFFSFIILKIEK